MSGITVILSKSEQREAAAARAFPPAVLHNGEADVKFNGARRSAFIRGARWETAQVTSTAEIRAALEAYYGDEGYEAEDVEYMRRALEAARAVRSV
jgi:hypothetical protein